MVPKNRTTNDAGETGKEKAVAEKHAHPGHDENCRCKVTSEMTPGELLKLMVSDLAFWKKMKKG